MHLSHSDTTDELDFIATEERKVPKHLQLQHYGKQEQNAGNMN